MTVAARRATSRRCRRVVDLPPPNRLGTLLVLEGAPRDAGASRPRCGRRSAAHAAAAGRLVTVEGAVPGLLAALEQGAAALAETIGRPRSSSSRPTIRASPPRRRTDRSRSSRSPTPTPPSCSPHATAATGRSRSGRATPRRASGSRGGCRRPRPGSATTARSGRTSSSGSRATSSRGSSSGARRGRRDGPARRRDPRRRSPSSATGASRAAGRRCGALARRPAQAVSDGPLRTDHSPLRTHPSAWTQGPPCRAFSFSPRAARNGEMSKGTRPSMQRMSEAAAPGSP